MKLQKIVTKAKNKSSSSAKTRYGISLKNVGEKFS